MAERLTRDCCWEKGAEEMRERWRGRGKPVVRMISSGRESAASQEGPRETERLQRERWLKTAGLH